MAKMARLVARKAAEAARQNIIDAEVSLGTALLTEQAGGISQRPVRSQLPQSHLEGHLQADTGAGSVAGAGAGAGVESAAGRGTGEVGEVRLGVQERLVV